MGYNISNLLVFTDKKMLLVLEKMSEIESRLPNDKFLRIHKSYIVY